MVSAACSSRLSALDRSSPQARRACAMTSSEWAAARSSAWRISSLAWASASARAWASRAFPSRSAASSGSAAGQLRRPGPRLPLGSEHHGRYSLLGQRLCRKQRLSAEQYACDGTAFGSCRFFCALRSGKGGAPGRQVFPAERKHFFASPGNIPSRLIPGMPYRRHTEAKKPVNRGAGSQYRLFEGEESLAFRQKEAETAGCPVCSGCAG